LLLQLLIPPMQRRWAAARAFVRLLLWTSQERRALAGRDPYGIKPLYI